MHQRPNNYSNRSLLKPFKCTTFEKEVLNWINILDISYVIQYHI